MYWGKYAVKFAVEWLKTLLKEKTFFTKDANISAKVYKNI